MRSTLLILFLIFSINSYAQNQEEYEYLSMTKKRREIILNIGSDTFKKIDVKREMDNDHRDLRPLLKRIQEFEKEGWEMVSSNAFSFSELEIGNYVLMRRRVSEGDD